MEQHSIIAEYQMSTKDNTVFPAELIWSYAVAIDQEYNGYFKETRHIFNDDGSITSIPANKLVLRKWLTNPSMVPYITDDIIDEGRRVRNGCKAWLFKKLSGTSTPFIDTALLVANKDWFTGNDWREISTISCLPSSLRVDLTQSELRKLVVESELLIGEIGDSIIVDIKIINSVFLSAYNKMRVTALAGNSLVNFFVTPSEHYKKDKTLHIKAKIKAFNTDKSTQLNYVRLA